MEFIRLKEEEQRRKRLMNIPKKLPRVAYLGKKKTKEDSYFEEQQEEQRPDSPILKQLDEPEYIEDRPYFYEDRPPTPVYVPKPPGVEIATQIEDGELFDFELEVEPILEVLIGRSLNQAFYELIEEHERDEYLLHKKQYEQKREFELINLQRMEAARIRREQEKDRRYNQTKQKKLYDTSSQKKLISKLFAKSKIKNLDQTAIRQLYELGFLKERFNLKLSTYMQKDIFPITNKLVFTNHELKNLVSTKMLEMKKKDLSNIHKECVGKENDRIKKIKDDLEIQKKIEIENEKKRLKEKAERKEKRRINRITTNINDNVISTKDTRHEVATISLCDIDDFSMFSDRIHIPGGLLGLSTIVLDELLKVYNLSENTPENIEFIANVLDEFIFKCLKDNQTFELKYLESERFNFKEIPEERKPEFIDFIHDYRRFVNKSLKILLDKNQLSKNAVDLILSAIVNLYFKDKTSIPVVEIDPENQNPEYLEKIKDDQENYVDAIARMEAVKKKINFVMIKPIILKKRRENMAAFIEIHPNLSIKDTITETDEIPLSERPKTTPPAVKNEENPNPNQEQMNAEGENAENQENQEKAENEENKEEEENNEQNQEIQVKEENENNQEEGENNEQNQEENNNEANKPNPEDPNIAENKEENKNLDNIKKNEPKLFKVEYFNEAQVFKNEKMKYEPYIIHHKIHEYSLINIAKSFRKVIKKNLKIEADLNELISISNHAYEKYSQYVVDWIMSNENYIKDKIVPIVISPIETKSEEPEVVVKNNNEIPVHNIEPNPEVIANNEEPQAQAVQE